MLIRAFKGARHACGRAHGLRKSLRGVKSLHAIFSHVGARKLVLFAPTMSRSFLVDSLIVKDPGRSRGHLEAHANMLPHLPFPMAGHTAPAVGVHVRKPPSTLCVCPLCVRTTPSGQTALPHPLLKSPFPERIPAPYCQAQGACSVGQPPHGICAPAYSLPNASFHCLSFGKHLSAACLCVRVIERVGALMSKAAALNIALRINNIRVL